MRVLPGGLVPVFGEVLVGQVAKLLLVDTDCGWGYLLVVADDHDLRRQVLQERRLQPGLGGLVDEDHVEHVLVDAELLGDPVDRHDPDRDRGAAAVHRLADLSALLRGVLAGALAQALDEGGVLGQVGLRLPG